MDGIVGRRAAGGRHYCLTIGQSVRVMDVTCCDGIPSRAAKSNVAGTHTERLHSIGKY
ncbi:MAG: hypothetical protein ACJAZ5_001614 [Alloalcanivorax venustensis]|jgi:hypothetical protein